MPDPTLDEEIFSDDDPYDEDRDVVPVDGDDTVELDMDEVWDAPDNLPEPPDFDDGSKS